MPEQMPPNAVFSEDQPVETGDPYNATDVGAEFDAMFNGAQNPAVDNDVDDSVDATANVAQADEAQADDQYDEAGDDAELDGDGDGGQMTYEALLAENQRLRAAQQGQAAAPQQAGVGGGQVAAAQPDYSHEPSIGELTADFTPEIAADVFAPRAWLGIAPGTTPEQEFEVALSSPQGLASFADRIRQSVIRDVQTLFPRMFEGNLKHTLGGAQLDQAFWSKNRDLEPHREVVDSVAFHLKNAEPHLKASEYLRKLEATVRRHVNKPKAQTKSGGVKPLPPRGAQQRGGTRKPQPALGGGSGARRGNAQLTGFDKEFNDMARVTHGR